MSVDSFTLGHPIGKARPISDPLPMIPEERTKANDMRLVSAGRLWVAEASNELEISKRPCYRLKTAFLACGDTAFVHDHRSMPSNCRDIPDAQDEVLTLIRRYYTGFWPTRISEPLVVQSRYPFTRKAAHSPTPLCLLITKHRLALLKEFPSPLMEKAFASKCVSIS